MSEMNFFYKKNLMHGMHEMDHATQWIIILSRSFFLKHFGVFGMLLLSIYATGQDQIPESFKLIYHQDFESPQAIQDFDFSDEQAWSKYDIGQNNVLHLSGASEYRSSVRSPFNIAVMNRLMVGDFIMEVSLSQTGKEYGHRDLCLFFGIQDPTNFYYVHIASVADDHANNVFIVNDEPRTKIASKTTTGTDWGAQGSWHKARIERTVSDGMIKVYFDDSDEPIMEAVDTHFGLGYIGLGSFDDTGMFDEMKIWAREVLVTSDSFFK